jgi:hypothetical protein
MKEKSEVRCGCSLGMRAESLDSVLKKDFTIRVT